jgi:hypothetical protein
MLGSGSVSTFPRQWMHTQQQKNCVFHAVRVVPNTQFVMKVKLVVSYAQNFLFRLRYRVDGYWRFGEAFYLVLYQWRKRYFVQHILTVLNLRTMCVATWSLSEEACTLALWRTYQFAIKSIAVYYIVQVAQSPCWHIYATPNCSNYACNCGNCVDGLRFGVLTAVTVQYYALRCRLVENYRGFDGTYCLYLRDWKISRAYNQKEARSLMNVTLPTFRWTELHSSSGSKSNSRN